MKNNRGAALLQVLMLSALLAGLSVMVLRAVLSRQVIARQTNHAVGSQLAIESCMAEIHDMWAVMNPETYKESLESCRMPTQKAMPDACRDDSGNLLAVPTDQHTWYCGVNPYNSSTRSYCVRAVMTPRNDGGNPPCQIQFAVNDGIKL